MKKKQEQIEQETTRLFTNPFTGEVQCMAPMTHDEIRQSLTRIWNLALEEAERSIPWIHPLSGAQMTEKQQEEVYGWNTCRKEVLKALASLKLLTSK